MRKIIPYIASDFRKDKIWLRRSRPSQRRYQVVLAIDDSKSMAENACGHLALESMVLLARAMARLEVGEIGVHGFGGGGGGGGDGEEVAEDAAAAVRTLHPLGAPFTDQGGPALVSQFTFAEDNTLADTPMVGLLKSLDAQLGAARENIRGGHEQLQQLCLIIADGRFHEKEALRRQMRDMSAKRGLLVAFIVLDNPKSSMLDMQSVSFAAGEACVHKVPRHVPLPVLHARAGHQQTPGGHIGSPEAVVRDHRGTVRRPRFPGRRPARIARGRGRTSRARRLVRR